MTRAEYALLVLGFLAILGFGLEGGIAIGIVLACLYFAYAYARVRHLRSAFGHCEISHAVVMFCFHALEEGVGAALLIAVHQHAGTDLRCEADP